MHIVQVNNEKKHEALNKIDDGTKVKYLFGEADLSSEKQKKRKKRNKKTASNFM